MIERLKRHHKGILIWGAAVLAMAAFVITMVPRFMPKVLKQEAKEVSVKIDSNYEADNLGGDLKFRSGAKFKILEIVPYHGMAEIGYSIAGEEPVDISKIEQEDFKNIMFQILHTEDGILKWDTTKKHLVNQNSFIKTTLKEGMQLTDQQVANYISNQSVDVLVVEPSQINAHPELIEQSNYISIHDDFAKSNNDYSNRILYFYEKYSYEAINNKLTKKYYNTGAYPVFDGNDSNKNLSMEVVGKLFHYAAIEELPISYPGYAVKEESINKSNNIQKLGYAVSVAKYLQYKKIKTITESYKKLFVDSHSNDKSFWNFKNLIKYLCPDKESQWDQLVVDLNQGYSDSVDNDFVGNYYDTTICAFAHGSGNESSFLSKLGSMDSFKGKIKTTDDEKWCEDVGNNTRDVSITFYNAYCPTMKVLDIEPDNKFTLSVFDVKSWLPAEVRIKVEVIPMTMSEFIGKVNDLNSDYDMIYFGKNVNRMKGNKIYYTGVSAASDSLSAMQGSGVNGSNFLYSGNDITERMANKVEEFLNAGYPVIYDEDLIDSGKVNNNTNIFDFLTDHKDNMYSVKDGIELSGGSASGLLDTVDVKLGKPKIFDTMLTTADEYDESTGTSIGTNGLNGLQINTMYGSGKYRAYLYIDGDHNGIYNEWKKNGGTYTLDSNYEQPIWSEDFEAGNTVKVENAVIPSRAMLGVVSYKIEVVKLSASGPTGIRTNMTGNVKCSASQKEIKVLQLSDLSSYSNMDLSSGSGEAAQFKKYAQKSTVSDRFDIKVTAMDILKSDFADIDLLNYDVILIGFINPDKKLSDPDGLLNKVNIAASKGKGVIFTRDALSYFNNIADAKHWGSNTNYSVRTLLGMDRFKAYAGGSATANDSEMAFTYSVLNKFSDEKYFSGLTGDITVTDKVSRINSAKIARYPYVIDTESDGFRTKSGIYQVDVNQKDEETLNGVAYFCLSGQDGEKNYTVSPRDVRNNYYVWRNDSVFYSGISRESFSGSYDNEVKLFINTIVSAYGLERSVDIAVDLYKISDFAWGKCYMLYADADFTEDSLSGSKPAGFILSVKGMSSPTIKISFYKADGDGNKVSSALELHHNGNKFSLSGSGSKSSEFTVHTETDYVYEYPYEYLSDTGNENILIEAVAKENGKTATDKVLIKALRRSMFDLD